jgi:hypothetical protein
MLNHPHIASQLAQQRQREMVAQASQWRLRRQLRVQAARTRAARPYGSWRVRARAIWRVLAPHPAFRRPAI